MSPGPFPAQVREVADLARAASCDPVIIAIDGRSGSGKTTFSGLLCADLADATIVHLDHIYPGWDGLASTPALLAAQVLTPLRRGEHAGYRRFDWDNEEFAELVRVPSAAFVIVEGAGSSVGIAGRYADVRVWLEADGVVRKRRALDRDGDAYRPHWQRWADQEDEVFGADRTPDHAHLVLRTS